MGIFLALFIVVILAPFAATSPDGLEKVAEDHAFIEKAMEGNDYFPIPDYEIPGLQNKTMAGIFAGITGVFLSFGGMILLMKLIRIPKKNNQVS
jgi:cobalt/nickel transport protein